MRRLRRLKGIGACIALAIAAAVVVTMQAAEVSRDWPTGDALASVVVSFDGKVVVLYVGPDGQTLEDTETIEVPGTNYGVTFTNALDLVVANASNDQLVQLEGKRSGVPLQHAQTTLATQDMPRALAVAGDGTLYVAAAGGKIRRFKKTPSGYTYSEFNVPVETSDCIGIDLGADGSLYVVSGGRNVSVVSNAETASDPVTVTPFTTKKLSGSGAACAIKILAPERRSGMNEGGALVADKVDIKRLNRFGQEVSAFKGSGSMQNWVDVAVDPRMVYDSVNPGDTKTPPTDVDPNEYVFWGVDAGQRRIARFRTDGGSSPSYFRSTGLDVPRSAAVNGELRVAQAVRLLTLAPGEEKSAAFLQDTTYPHSWKAKSDLSNSATAQLAVMAFEGLSDGTLVALPDGSGLCSPSLEFDCRFYEYFATGSPLKTPAAVAYSRGRATGYRVVRLDTQAAAVGGIVSIVYADGNAVGGGTACGTGGTATSIMRDPYLGTAPAKNGHDQFEFDFSRAFFDFDDGSEGETLPDMGTDYIVAARQDLEYSATLKKPVSSSPPTEIQLGRSLPITWVASTLNNCQPVQYYGTSPLSEFLVLTVTELGGSATTTKGTRVGDSGTPGSLGVNGLEPWVFNGAEWRTNLALDPPTFKEETFYSVCVVTKAVADKRLTNDTCAVVKVVKGAGQ